jgi:putative Holliday junction resolvase
MPKTMAIDLGSRRVGLAVTDDSGQIALPLTTLTKERKRSDRIRRILRLGTQRNVECYVVGLPVRLSGEEGPEALAAREFAETLHQRSGLPVELHDESCTTLEAHEAMTESGVSFERQREVVDQVAAVVILQSWLAQQEMCS